MSAVRYCKDCAFSKPEEHSTWTLRCHNPVVNRDDPWALSQTKMNGSCCRSERERVWFAQCGKAGKLFEEKKL